MTHHAADLGEEDWLHTGEPLIVADGLEARLCMSIHPATGERDGPYVLIGTNELTLEETAHLGGSLLAMAHASNGAVVGELAAEKALYVCLDWDCASPPDP